MSLGAVAPAMGQLFGAVCDWSLWLLLRGVEAGRATPGSHFWSPGPGDAWLAVFYLGLVTWLTLPQWRPRASRCIALLLAWIGIGFGHSIWTAPRGDQLRCTFLSVGHGTAVVLELPGGQTILYDAGRMGSAATGARIIADFLWRQGHRQIDGIVLSHADTDHYNAAPRLLDRFAVKNVYVSPVMFDGGQRALETLRVAIDRADVERRTIWSGDRLRAGDCRLEVLHPGRKGVIGSDNANSLVVSVEYMGRRILLAGDLEPPGLHDLLAESPMHCDVLMAPHHGSSQSDPPGMAAWSTPDHVIISGSRRDRSAAVIRAYTERGSQILHTSDVGAVSVVVDRDGLRVSTGRTAVD